MRKIVVVAAIVTALSACVTSGRSARQVAHQSLLQVARTADVAMTLFGRSYRAGLFGVVGSSAAEGARARAERASKSMSVAIYGAIAALEAGRDAAAYAAAIDDALTQLAELGAIPSHSDLGPPSLMPLGGLSEIAYRLGEPSLYVGGER